MEITKILKNAQNAQEMALHMFPNEQWIGIDQHILWQLPEPPGAINKQKFLSKS